MSFAWAMGSLGLLVGLFAAWSASPVVATLLPLIFGIVGGASGFVVQKMNVTKPESQAKLRELGASLGAFCLVCTIALVMGVWTKPMLMAHYAKQPPTLNLPDDLPPTARVKIFVLRTKLQAMGASDGEITALAAAALKEDAKLQTVWASEPDLNSAFALIMSQKSDEKNSSSSFIANKFESWPYDRSAN